MAPKPEGFNLAGYLVPGITILAVGAAITAVILRRRKVGLPDLGHSDGQTVRRSDGPNPADLDRLQKALTEVAD